MSKTTTVYKVLDKLDGKLVSGYSRNPYKKEYNIGKTTLPVPGTKLFAFTNLKEAKDYSERSFTAGFLIFEAEAVNVKKNGWLNHPITDLNTLRRLFELTDYSEPVNTNGREQHMSNAHFNSCVVCDSIKLTRQIQ